MAYVSVENQKAIAPAYKQAIIVVFACFIGVLLMLLLGKVLQPNSFIPGSEQWQKMIYTGVLILGLFVVVLRRLILSGAVTNRAGGAAAVAQKMTVATIIIAALAEAIAIAGLVFYFLTGNYDYSWRLGVIGLFLLAYGFPRRAEWERIVARGTEEQKR
jgi:hypothetical protein